MDSAQLAASVKTTLQAKLISEFNRLNPGIDPKTITAAVTKALDKQAPILVDDVFKASNEALNIVPSQLVGQKNPANIVTSNLGKGGFYDNFNNIIKEQLSQSTSDKIFAAIESEFLQLLHPSESTNIDFGSLKTSVATATTSTVESAISSTFKSYGESLFTNTPKVKPIITNIGRKLTSAITGALNSLPQAPSAGVNLDAIEAALEKIDLDFSKSLTSKSLQEAQNFNLDTEDNIEKLQNVSTGFTDPSATYPTKEYAGQSETNKLAKGEINGTIVQKKNDSRIIGARLPFGDSFSEPLSPFNGEYPYNKVTQTESGHVIEVDDTPGNERLHIYHKSGTYIEIDSNGSVVKRAKGSSYEFIDCNGKIAILGKADISVNGACNIFVGNDANMEVMGNVNLTCHNDITAMAGGKLDLSAAEEINIHAANVNIEADKILNILADGELRMLSGNALTLTSNTDSFLSSNVLHISSKNELYVGSEQELNIKSNSSINIQAKETLNETAGDVAIASEQDVNFLAGGDVNADGNNVFLNSGTASDAEPATPASYPTSIAATSKVGLLEGRKYSYNVEITDPDPIRYDARYTEKGEGYIPSEKELNAQKDILISSGIASKDELEDKNPVVISESSPSSAQGTIILPDEKLLSRTALPGNYKLSPNFTLDNMWRTVAVSPGKHPIQPQVGLTYGQIVYNLQALALNVLEPVRALYPKMVITSCFRHPSDNPKSSHSAGLAVDLQFPGASREEYYDIAVKLAQVLAYDQILLEYWVQANNPWIHIGIGPQGQFTPTSQRKVAWTFKDHKLYKQSLVNLA